MSILSLPSEMLVQIATYLGTTGNLANFKMTCARIYDAVESAKVDRKRLPHLKIQEIRFYDLETQKIGVRYQQKNEDAFKKMHDWDYTNPSSKKLHILIQHWILEDNCKITFFSYCILAIPLLKSLSEINYGNAIQCEIRGNSSNPSEVQEALPFIHEFLKKASCFLKMLFLLHNIHYIVRGSSFLKFHY